MSVVSPVLRVADLIGALSHALDLTEGQPEGHALRVCWIGMHLGHSIGLTQEELSNLYYVLLLKDLGCSSTAARVCELYLTDDRQFKRDFKLMNDSLPAVLRFVLKNTASGASALTRIGSVVNILVNGKQIAKELFEARCYRGADIARQMRFPDEVCKGVSHLDEHWDGSGKPDGLSGRAIPLASQVALLAQVADVFFMVHGRSAAIKEVTERATTWLDPSLVDVFLSLSDDDAFWSGLTAADLKENVLALEPEETVRTADENYLDDVALAFAKVIDAKSPFTGGHSERVADYTGLIALEMGLPLPTRRMLRRAALLHDIGKLGISNSILDKPDKLTDDEFNAIKQHPVYSHDILSRVDAFNDISEIALNHHEKLDGSGYPRGLRGIDISMHTRIVTIADIFDALTADRPYRGALPMIDALAIIRNQKGTKLDSLCVSALSRALGKRERRAA